MAENENENKKPVLSFRAEDRAITTLLIDVFGNEMNIKVAEVGVAYQTASATHEVHLSRVRKFAEKEERNEEINADIEDLEKRLTELNGKSRLTKKQKEEVAKIEDEIESFTEELRVFKQEAAVVYAEYRKVLIDQARTLFADPNQFKEVFETHSHEWSTREIQAWIEALLTAAIDAAKKKYGDQPLNRAARRGKRKRKG